jgi:hypothetical protein
MTLTSYETGFPINIDWDDVQAFKSERGERKTWLKTFSGRIVCVRETMKEIESIKSGKGVKHGLS